MIFIVILLVFLLSLSKAEWNTKDYLNRDHTLIKPYSDDRWNFIGSTVVTGNYVRLTMDQQSQKGAIWNRLPCYVRNWELHVHFKVYGTGDTLFGDGLAIWYAKDRMELGDVFGSKDFFQGLAIFLDTYNNHNGPHNHGHPYVSAMVNNGSFHYDHDRDGTHTELAGCEAHFRGAKDETYVAIRYEKDKLSVSVDIEGKNAWKPCFAVDGVRLPTGYYFGASATTGDLADNHDIISMKLYDLDQEASDGAEDRSKIAPSADFFAPPRDHVEDPTGAYNLPKVTGWRLFVIILLSVVGLGVCAVVGFIVFAKRQDDRRKRFY